MRVTVCEMPHDESPLAAAWDGLVEHCRSARPDVVVLPEMPFSEWLAATRDVDHDRWQTATDLHETWLERLPELEADVVIGARPVVVDGSRHNEGFIWDRGSYRATHHKYYLPDEEGFWEATWYEPGPAPRFAVMDTSIMRTGSLLCTELWFTEHARALGRDGASVIASPRATEWDTRDRWVIGGQAAAIMSGAFSVSSNHSGTDAAGMRWGGRGWVIDPSGQVVTTTSADEPFCTVDIDPAVADHAKLTYPRYVTE